MVRQVFSIMHREVRGLHQAAYILAFFTFGSQLLALIRDRLLAHQFGAGIELDLYYTAFRIPDILYVIFASTLSVYVLIPFVSERIKKHSAESARVLFSQIFSLFLIVYISIGLLVCIFAGQIVTYLFPGFASDVETLTLLVRILMLQPLLLGISSLYGVITQMHYRFVLYAVGPLLYNMGIIGGLVFLYPYMGIAALAVGVVLGAMGHLCVQLPYVLRTSLSPRLVFSFDFAEIRKILNTSFARALTLSLHQLILLTLIGFASIMTVGSVSVFQFAFNLQSVPLAIIGVSYSVAAFPLLAQLYAEKQMDVFGRYVSNTLKHILFWSLPVIVLFIVIRAQFVRVILGSGEFDWSDTRLTAAVLAVFIVSLTAQAVHLLMVRALYAVGDTKTPFYVTLFSSLLTLILALYLYVLVTTNQVFSARLDTLMRLDGVYGTEVLVLPLAYSCALLVHGFIMLLIARKKLHISLRALLKTCIQASIASIGAGYVAYSVLKYTVMIFTADTLMTVLIQGILAGSAGVCVYFLLQYLLKSEELFEVFGMCKNKLTRKQEMVTPQDEDTLAV